MDSIQVPPDFLVGLRVLIVDDDSASLTVLEKMLKKCKYEVTSASSAKQALEILAERKDWFEIVICDVNDVFKFVEDVRKLDIPVIMTSRDRDTSRVVRSVVAGACDYLVKPIGLKELETICQHVLRKKIHHRQQIQSSSSSNAEKRNTRLVWTSELHQKFIQAVHQSGGVHNVSLAASNVNSAVPMQQNNNQQPLYILPPPPLHIGPEPATNNQLKRRRQQQHDI